LLIGFLCQLTAYLLPSDLFPADLDLYSSSLYIRHDNFPHIYVSHDSGADGFMAMVWDPTYQEHPGLKPVRYSYDLGGLRSVLARLQ
jgi:hypothetical protein